MYQPNILIVKQVDIKYTWYSIDSQNFISTIIITIHCPEKKMVFYYVHLNFQPCIFWYIILYFAFRWELRFIKIFFYLFLLCLFIKYIINFFKIKDILLKFLINFNIINNKLKFYLSNKKDVLNWINNGFQKWLDCVGRKMKS